jgi:hypothetical protein
MGGRLDDLQYPFFYTLVVSPVEIFDDGISVIFHLMHCTSSKKFEVVMVYLHVWDLIRHEIINPHQ